MKKFLLFLPLVFTFLFSNAQSPNIVISEVYGGGGNSGATYRNDFVELHNTSSCPVNISGWSVQYASATGTSWTAATLTGTIPAKGYYLVQLASGGAVGANLPTPDATGSMNMSATAGKVALVNVTTALTGTNPTGTQIVDKIGYGGTASSFEGTGPAPAGSNTASMERKASATSTATTLAAGGSEVSAGNGYDTDNNSTNFVSQSITISPQNLASGPEGSSGPSVSVFAGSNAAEPDVNGSFTITLSNNAPAGGTVVTYNYSGTATFGSDFTDADGGTVIIPAGSTSATVTIDITDDNDIESTETVILNLNPVSGYSSCTPSASINMVSNDGPPTGIHNVNGTTGTYIVEGIVTSLLPSWSPGGYYIQESESNYDANPNTSEAIFVVHSSPSVNVGDRVRIVGEASENGSSPSFNQAVIVPYSTEVISTGNPLPAPQSLTLPVSSQADLERFEGMIVQYNGTLTVSDNSDLGNRGSVKLSAGGVVYQPTQIVDPNDNPASGTSSSGSSNVAAVTAYNTSNINRTIILDDANGSAPTTLPYVDANNTLRVGSTITNPTGILAYGFSAYRLQPLSYAPPVFSYAPRPAAPSDGGSNFTAASFNVLNYFNGDGVGGGFPTSRGANSLAEFNRQRDKIINALVQLDADVVGLLELENDGTGPNSAIQDLVNGLNTVMGAGTYAFIDDGASVQPNNTDEIRSAIIYKPAVVTPVGSVMISTNTALFERPVVAQNFELNENDKQFNYAINHFKSKGGCPGSGVNADQGDGQSCWNDRRRLQAAGLVDFLNTVVYPTSGNNRVITMGDYNSYYEEDPMDVLRANGFNVLGNGTDYSYIFQGQLGSLDHAVVSASLSGYVNSISKWNTNSTEPTYLDYNDGVQDAGESASDVNQWAGFYTVSPWRSSDHDAILVAFNISEILPVQLLSIDATKKEDRTLINWKTTTEINSKEFLIERSADGINFHSIGNVIAKGNSISVSEYSFIDHSPNKAVNYYRLKMVDNDQQYQYSRVMKVNFAKAFSILITPNPATNAVTIRLDKKTTRPVNFVIRNAAGATLQNVRLNSGEQTVSISVNDLSKGMYFVECEIDEVRQVVKLIKY